MSTKIDRRMAFNDTTKVKVNGNGSKTGSRGTIPVWVEYPNCKESDVTYGKCGGAGYV